jgi:hypothetical protein
MPADLIRPKRPARARNYREQVQALSGSVTSLLEATKRLREMHKDCVPREWCDKRMEKALARGDRRERWYQRLILMLVGAFILLLLKLAGVNLPVGG